MRISYWSSDVCSSDLSQDGKPIPVDVRDLQSSVSVSGSGGQVVLNHVALAVQDMHVKAQGEVRLLELRKPWPLDGHLALELDGQGADSPLCVRRYVDRKSTRLNSSH